MINTYKLIGLLFLALFFASCERCAECNYDYKTQVTQDDGTIKEEIQNYKSKVCATRDADLKDAENDFKRQAVADPNLVAGSVRCKRVRA
jgi:hypothetical protein